MFNNVPSPEELAYIESLEDGLKERARLELQFEVNERVVDFILWLRHRAQGK